MKCELDLYEYKLVHTGTYFSPQVLTKYVLSYLSMWVVHNGMYCVYKNIAGNAVLCMTVGNMTVGNNTLCAWHVCSGAQTLNQYPSCCPTYMTSFWYVLLVGTYWYVPVCTILHFLSRYRDQYVLVRTSTYWYIMACILNTLSVEVPVQLFTIADVPGIFNF